MRRRRPWTSRLAALAAALGLVAAAGGGAGTAAAASCPAGQGEARTVEAGIVKAVGCFTSSRSSAGATVYTARGDVDLNGFIVTPGASGFSIDTGTSRVWGGGADGRTTRVQLKSRNWPTQGKDEPIGSPFVLDFVAPATGSIVIEQLEFGSNSIGGSLAGFSPVGSVATPIELAEDGTGSMNLTITLAGYFTLKGKPQSAVVDLPTASGEGTRLDGFEIRLEEIDAIRVLRIDDFEAEYSASEKRLAGGATLWLPFMRGRSGFGGRFAIQDGKLVSIGMQAAGLEIPIGAPPAGEVTEIGGGIDILDDDKGFDLNAHLGADFGPELPTPWGRVAPIFASADLSVGYDKGEAFFTIRGGVEIFRLPAGDVYLAIYTNTGVKFGAGLGIGFPSYRNNPNDPFYIGARVDGWVAGSKYQFEGRGRVALANLKLFDGQILVNDQVAGACWVVLGFPGGAYYRYGDSKVNTFGVACGLDRFREQFPRGAAAVAAGARRAITLDRGQIALTVAGRGGPPRFTLRSADGRRVYRTPAPGRDPAEVARDHLVYVNETGTNTTHVMLRNPAGRWTVEPHDGSPPITSLRAGRKLPRERVRAEVRGRGAVRTLVWRSTGQPNTRLVFTERLRGGVEVPILTTGRANGRHRFRVAQGSHYGARRLRVVVKHGPSSRQSAQLDRYRVRRPARLTRPRRVRAARDRTDVRVRWARVRRASGYLVELTTPRGASARVRYARRVGPRRRQLVFRDTVGGQRLVARVYALNADGRPGRARAHAFAASPSARSVAAAARAAARSASGGAGATRVRSQCPPGGGHCQVRVTLRSGGRVIASERVQQAPGTFQRVTVRAPRSVVRASGPPPRAVVEVARGGKRMVAHAPR